MHFFFALFLQGGEVDCTACQEPLLFLFREKKCTARHYAELVGAEAVRSPWAGMLTDTCVCVCIKACFHICFEQAVDISRQVGVAHLLHFVGAAVWRQRHSRVPLGCKF